MSRHTIRHLKLLNKKSAAEAAPALEEILKRMAKKLNSSAKNVRVYEPRNLEGQDLLYIEVHYNPGDDYFNDQSAFGGFPQTLNTIFFGHPYIDDNMIDGDDRDPWVYVAENESKMSPEDATVEAISDWNDGYLEPEELQRCPTLESYIEYAVKNEIYVDTREVFCVAPTSPKQDVLALLIKHMKNPSATHDKIRAILKRETGTLAPCV